MPPPPFGKEPNLRAVGSATGTSSAKTAIRAGNQVDRAKIQVCRRVGQDTTTGLENEGLRYRHPVPTAWDQIRGLVSLARYTSPIPPSPILAATE